MFEYIASYIGSRTDHPLLVSLFALAGIFLVSGFVVESITGNGAAAGFLAIFAILATFLGLIGYLFLFLARIASRIVESRLYSDTNTG
ncbi:hypothetical protein [Halosimplex amylolyticum]|uniref:hypothetical protein n=1 Tax=Halosimplex amylolyticum TaxID=3396616 RepID=UPI003F57705D